MEVVSKDERLDTLQRIELAEGVNIRLRVAGLPVRVLAFALDYLICVGVIVFAIVVISVIGIALDPGSSSGIFGLLLLLWFCIRWFYHVPFEMSKKGATPGKRAMNIRVVRTTGTPVTLGQSIIRNLLRFIDEMPAFILPTYLLGSVSMVFNKRFQRLGDLAAGTIVIYDDENITSLPAQFMQQQVPLPVPQYSPMGYYTPPKPQPPPIPPQPTMPRFPLHREEQLAFTSFRERLPLWTEARQIEIANHLFPLTDKMGPQGVHEVLNIGAWIDQAK